MWDKKNMVGIKCFSWFCHLLTSSLQAKHSIHHTSFLIQDRCLGKHSHNLCQTSIANPNFTPIQDVMLSVWRKYCSWPVNIATKLYGTARIKKKVQMYRTTQKILQNPVKDNTKIIFKKLVWMCVLRWKQRQIVKFQDKWEYFDHVNYLQISQEEYASLNQSTWENSSTIILWISEKLLQWILQNCF